MKTKKHPDDEYLVCGECENSFNVMLRAIIDLKSKGAKVSNTNSPFKVVYKYKGCLFNELRTVPHL